MFAAPPCSSQQCLALCNFEGQDVFQLELGHPSCQRGLVPLQVLQVAGQRVPVTQNVHGNAVLSGVRWAVESHVTTGVDLEQHIFMRGLPLRQQLER